MPPSRDEPIPSKVTIHQHPLHPMLVVFPIAFLLFNFVTDVVFWWLSDEFWAWASFWLGTAGFVMGVIAGVVGSIDFIYVKQVRRHVAGWSHFIVAIMALSLAGMNVQLRWADPVAAALPWGMFVSAVMVVMVGIAGWLGGTLTFRYGIGTYGDAHHDRALAEADRKAEEARRK